MKAAFLIHGFMTDSADFARLAPLLSARYSFVYCPDLPFHSKSELKTQMKSKVVIEFVTAKFDELKKKYKEVDVFGFSMGGALAIHLSKIRDVSRLILLAPANKYISAGYIFSAAKYYIDGASRYKKKQQKGDECISCFEDVKKDNLDAAKMFIKRLLPRYTPKNLSEFAKVIRTCNKDLKQITPPMLIIWGRLDQLVPPLSVSYLSKLCTNALVVKKIYGDLSHYMLYSRSFYHVLDAIFLFLEQSGPPLLTYCRGEVLPE